MPVEIERKFLVNKEKWALAAKPNSEYYEQGYMKSGKGVTLRVRVTPSGGYITIKGPSTGASRSEYEYSIPVKDAVELLKNFCKTHIQKNRTKIDYQGNLWEVDEFLGDNEGLVIAEIELQREDDKFALPDWVAQEVTGDKRYSNAKLAKKPYNSWNS